MDYIPTIAIVGRPNVGKSSLLNRIVGYRHAIVDSTSGVTRDRNYAESTWNGRKFNVVDTGGLDPDDEKPLMKSIKIQVDFALDEADCVIFVCDARAGIVPDDKAIYKILRKECQSLPVFIAVNKLDNPRNEENLIDFYEFGTNELYPISAVHGHGVADLLDDVVKNFEINDVEKNVKKKKRFKELERIAIVGKPNVGKSSLFNLLLGEQRAIVDNVPGTTRDTLLVKCEREGKSYHFIDTAGLRRPSVDKDSVEQFSIYRTLGAIKKTDLVILVLNSEEGIISNQDKRIAGRIIDSGAGCIIVWNKWDIVDRDEHKWNDILRHTRDEFPLLAFAPMISTSAKTGLRVNKLFDLIDQVQENGRKRVTNEQLKTILFDAITIQPPPSYKGRPIRIHSIKQFDGPPIIFKVKCSEPKGLHFSYQRYLLNHIKQEELFEGWPVKMYVGK